MGHNALSTWRGDADGQESWVDPGRPEQGIPFTRED
jgi:hypothetical protein